ncbi:peptidoglycan-associated lipoprotein Pal [Sulfurivirga sp.]|uniref:peptidoglycan-associated lipoprotein Pal n=1 Tax=Sulfurivirga sp. TaxID=2614236 RepID=UPI0025F298FE|nr:peptidoglycan-associated lipoprotein Pal [Sulfurivirga sp.]
MKKLTTLFAAGFVALALSGCSSTPKEETKKQPERVQTTEQTSQPAETGTAAEQGLSAEALQQKIAELRKERVHFDFDKSAIKPEFFDVIKKQADFMAENPDVKVTIAGYCDERGSLEYNLALGERRANAVYNALVAQGISPERIQTVSYGESYPLDPAHNEAAWSKNRRATFVYGVGEFVRPH